MKRLGCKDMLFYGACATDIGSSRKNNQDAILFKKVSKRGGDFALGVICDGIGGLEHGEVASQCVSNAASQWFDNIAEWIDIETMNTDILFAHFKDAAENWNCLVRNIIISQNMNTGTTMSALLLLRDHYFIIHVGDSRIYRYRDTLERMTTDESIAKICNSRMKLFLLNYVGRDDSLSFSSEKGILLRGDIFIYGSDGFYHMLTECDMDSVCGQIADTGNVDLCRTMINTMIQRGEQDNISVGMIYCT